jgi:hypothetical protein
MIGIEVERLERRVRKLEAWARGLPDNPLPESKTAEPAPAQPKTFDCPPLAKLTKAEPATAQPGPMLRRLEAVFDSTGSGVFPKGHPFRERCEKAALADLEDAIQGELSEVAQLQTLRHDCLHCIDGLLGPDADDGSIVSCCLEWREVVRSMPKGTMDPEVETLREGVEKLLAERDRRIAELESWFENSNREGAAARTTLGGICLALGIPYASTEATISETIAKMRERLAELEAERDRWKADYEKKALAYAAVYGELQDLKRAP